MIFHYPIFFLDSKTKAKAKSEMVCFLCVSTMLHHSSDGDKPPEQTSAKLTTCPLSLNPGWMPFWKTPARQRQDIKLKTGII